MNEKEIKVNKIYSYQTLIYKNGKYSFKKQTYIDYENEIRYQLGGLIRIEDLSDLKVSIEFKAKDKTIGDADNLGKCILDILQRNGNIKNDRQIVELNLKKSFKHKENSIVIKIEKI